MSVVKNYTANENSSVRKTKQNRLMLLSNYANCDKKKSAFIKNQELSNLSQSCTWNSQDLLIVLVHGAQLLPVKKQFFLVIKYLFLFACFSLFFQIKTLLQKKKKKKHFAAKIAT